MRYWHPFTEEAIEQVPKFSNLLPCFYFHRKLDYQSFEVLPWLNNLHSFDHGMSYVTNKKYQFRY